MRATIEAEGPLVLPKSVLDEMGIRPGAILHIHVENGALIARAETREEAIRARYGSVNLGMTTNEYLANLRDPE